jgi:hypothetical protein
VADDVEAALDVVYDGDIWQLGDARWQVVGIREGVVHLSGPLPCRGMTQVSIADLLMDAKLISRLEDKKIPTPVVETDTTIPFPHSEPEKTERVLVVLSDGETYEEIEGASIVVVTKDEWERIEEGEKIRHIITDPDRYQGIDYEP